jgi:signal transduction histidine kinase
MQTKFNFPWRGLTPQLFIIVVLPLAALLVLVTYGGLRLHHTSMRGLVAERDERTVRAAALILEEELRQRQQAAHSLALSLAGLSRPADLQAELAAAAELFPEFDAGVAVFDAQGRLLAAQATPELEIRLQDESLGVGLAAHFSGAEAGFYSLANTPGGEQVLAAASPGTAEQPLVVSLFYPLKLLEQTLGVVFPAGEKGVVFVADAQRNLLYASGTAAAELNLVEHAGVRAALNQESGSAFFSGPESENVMAYAPVRPVNWALVVEEPWEEVASPLLRLTEYAPLIFIPVFLLGLVVLWYVTSQIVQPLLNLEEKASALAWGDFEAIKGRVGGVDEISHLQDTLIHLAEKVRAAQQALRGYIGAITRGQEEERRRLARELHDDTLQSLIALNQRVQFVRLQDGQPAAPDAVLEEIQALTAEAIQDVRRFTRALRPIYLEDLGLVAALDMLVRETVQSSGVQVSFQRQGDELRLPPEVELVLYRITQEALSNAVRHSYASEVEVTLDFDADGVRLEILDNGRGFEVPESPAEFAPEGHYGLLGMHERVELIGARLEIVSQPAEGTRLTVRVPLDGEVG